VGYFPDRNEASKARITWKHCSTNTRVVNRSGVIASLILLYCGFLELDDVRQILDAGRLPWGAGQYKELLAGRVDAD
jgi:hypothetical protein